MIHGIFGFWQAFIYLLEVEKKLGKLQEMHSRLSNRVIVKFLYRVMTVIPMHSNTKRAGLAQ